jgi:hypothetical protein
VKAEPSSDSSQRQETWRIFLGTVLVTCLSAVTVLGAILLSLQNQPQGGQPVVRQPESGAPPLIPTAAIATPPPITLVATLPASGTGEPPIEASATPGGGAQETSTLPPEAYATPTLLGITVLPPSPTPLLCAGGVPLDWRLYIVQRGDTLFSLARRHGTTVNQVMYINCLGSTRLWVGQRLYLPAPPTPIPPATTTFTPTPSPSPTLPSLTPSLPPSPTAILTLTASPSPFPPLTVTSTARPTVFPSETPTMTLTPSATAPMPPTETTTSEPTAEVTTTATPTSYPTTSATPTPMPSPSPSLPPTPTSTPTPIPTSSPVPTPTATPTPVS